MTKDQEQRATRAQRAVEKAEQALAAALDARAEVTADLVAGGMTKYRLAQLYGRGRAAIENDLDKVRRRKGA